MTSSSATAHVPARMVKVPAGTAALRDDRVDRRWTVDLQPFLLSTCATTQAEYERVTGRTPSANLGDRLPVECVSWHDAVEFCNLLSRRSGLAACYGIGSDPDDVEFDGAANGFRLPLDAEWQYACQGGTDQVRYGELDEIAWYEDNSGGRTHAVGEKRPNAWGLHDMLGNVWEWCWDLYDPRHYGTYRIIRGGGWDDPARGCLATNRRRSHPTLRIDDRGFRVARSLDLPPDQRAAIATSSTTSAASTGPAPPDQSSHRVNFEVGDEHRARSEVQPPPRSSR